MEARLTCGTFGGSGGAGQIERGAAPLGQVHQLPCTQSHRCEYGYHVVRNPRKCQQACTVDRWTIVSHDANGFHVHTHRGYIKTSTELKSETGCHGGGTVWGTYRCRGAAYCTYNGGSAACCTYTYTYHSDGELWCTYHGGDSVVYVPWRWGSVVYVPWRWRTVVYVPRR